MDEPTLLALLDMFAEKFAQLVRRLEKTEERLRTVEARCTCSPWRQPVWVAKEEND